MRMNLNSRDKLDDCFARSLDFQPYVEVQHGTYFWAFGRTPNGQEHIDTLPDLLWDSYGYGGSSVPREGWHGVRIVSPQGRRFHSSVVMAMQCGDNTFRCCEDASAVPRTGCLGSYNECHTLSEAIFIEQFDPLNPEHQLSGEHKCQECPDCFRLGDRCSKMKKQHVQTCPELWMQGRTFQKTEGGLETTVVFENVEVRVLCYPEMFVLNKSVWELGQQAPSGAKGSRQWFDTAFRLSNDKFSRDRPTNLADVLLLLNYATKPKPTRLLKTQQSAKRNAPSADEDPWRAAVNASSSVDVFDVMMRAVTWDREQLRDHMRQKAVIGEILKVEYGFSPSFKTGNPEGWITFPVRAAEAWEGRLVDECYHGTSMTNLAPILLEGLRKPQSRSEEAHGQWGSKSKQSIYASPSWYYAAHPVYSPLHFCKAGQAFQLVWKCIVRRGSYRSQRGTLGSKHWSKDLRMDPDHDTMDNMEYLIEEEGNICIKEVMFREFGSAADSRIYGELPSQLEVEAFTDADKLNAGWTEMLQKDFKKRGLFLRRPAVL
eukprot:s7229_g1.t1